jgi:hypothetical protein
MATKLVDLVTSGVLDCAGCSTADVILCISPIELIAQKDCAGEGVAPEVDFPWHTIEAKLINYSLVGSACGTNNYKYTFSYDDAQLVEGSVLIPSNIRGVVCRGCETTYIDDKVGYDVTLSLVEPEEGPAQIRLVNQHGCVFDVPQVGITLVNDDEDCLGSGVGYMVRTLSLVGTTLTIRSAPEHTSVIGGEVTATGSAVTAVAVGQYIPTIGELVINNPSECRDALVYGWIIAPTGWNQGMGDRVIFNVQGSFIAPPTIESITSGIYEAYFTGADSTFRAQLRQEFYRHVTGTIPPGGSVTFYQRIDCNLPVLTSGTVNFFGTTLAANYHLTTV